MSIRTVSYVTLATEDLSGISADVNVMIWLFIDQSDWKYHSLYLIIDA